MERTVRGFPRWRTAGTLAAALTLASLVLANAIARATWAGVDDGVLWSREAGGVRAVAVAPGGPGDRAGIAPGDLLLAVGGREVSSARAVSALLAAHQRGDRLAYRVVHQGVPVVRVVTLGEVPSGSRQLYFVLAGVALFTLFVGTGVRIRRPSDQATLHFFWLTVAFAGVFGFSFSGRLDALDWFFYWADVIATLLLPPLFLHFALEFPERSLGWTRQAPWPRLLLATLYAPAALLGATRAAALAGGVRGERLTTVLDRLDRIELVYLAVGVLGGLAVMARALGRVQSMTARRQLRWIVWGSLVGGVPFFVGYAVPFVLGFDPPPRAALTAIPLGLVPLAFASAIVRYRLLDIELIVKRGLVYAAAASLIVAMYFALERLAMRLLLGGTAQHHSVIALLATLVVVLLAPRVRDLIQTALDRAHYRDRYDYRRALVGFARDLNADLDVQRLSERLVARVVETLVVDRMALLLAPLEGEARERFEAVATAGFEDGAAPVLRRDTEVGARVAAGHPVALDDPLVARRFAPQEVAFWRRHGLHYFVPCVAKEGTIAVLALGRRRNGEPLTGEDLALLAAVAGQIATALENGRLYRQLQLKAAELDRMRAFSDNIIESLGDGLAVVDEADRVVRWNRALEQLSGVPRTGAVGRRLEELFDEDFVAALRAARREAPEGTVLYRVPLVSRRPESARRLLVNAATAPVRSPDGRTAATVLLIEDMTARVQLEEQLQIAEKMASIGLLAAGVAHEINTPLAGISSFTQMLLRDADPDDPRTRLLEKIERQTFRAAKIVNGLLNLARPPQTEKGPVDLNAVINDVLSLVEHQFAAHRITLRKELAPAALIVRGVEHKLQQVFLNLVLNARDAMPKGGWLRISTRAEGDQAIVEVEDTGVGIPREHLARIYDPFFTTKAIGQGTGLGLSITYGIVQEHEGTIRCESTVGRGTCFSLTLPLAAAGEAAGATEGSAPRERTATST
jgi:two-component system NtrC family sensor kinase